MQPGGQQPPQYPHQGHPGPGGPAAQQAYRQAMWYQQPAAAPRPRQPPVPPRKRRNAGTAVAAGIVALFTALVYGGYGLLAMIVVASDAAGGKAAIFGVVVVGGVLAVVGAIMIFSERVAARIVLLVACLTLTVGSVLLAVVPIPGFLRDGADDPRMLLHLVGILPALVIALLVLLPSTGRYLTDKAEPEQQPGYPQQPGSPQQMVATAPVTAAGKALAIAASVCGLLLGVILLTIVADAGFTPLEAFEGILQFLGTIMAVVGACVAFARKWSGGLVLAIGGGTALTGTLIILLRANTIEMDFRGWMFLLSSIGALVLPLLPPARNYLRSG